MAGRVRFRMSFDIGRRKPAATEELREADIILSADPSQETRTVLFALFGMRDFLSAQENVEQMGYRDVLQSNMPCREFSRQFTKSL